MACLPLELWDIIGVFFFFFFKEVSARIWAQVKKLRLNLGHSHTLSPISFIIILLYREKKEKPALNQELLIMIYGGMSDFLGAKTSKFLTTGLCNCPAE